MLESKIRPLKDTFFLIHFTFQSLKVLKQDEADLHPFVLREENRKLEFKVQTNSVYHIQ